MVQLTPHFTSQELACPSTGKYRFSNGFLDRLELLRVNMNEPIIVSSCARSFTHNQSIGGHERSLHVYDLPHHPTDGCCAIDIHAETGGYKGRLIYTAWHLGWSIGVASNFVHLDDRTNVLSMPQILYTY